MKTTVNKRQKKVTIERANGRNISFQVFGGIVDFLIDTPTAGNVMQEGYFSMHHEACIKFLIGAINLGTQHQGFITECSTLLSKHSTIKSKVAAKGIVLEIRIEPYYATEGKKDTTELVRVCERVPRSFLRECYKMLTRHAGKKVA